MIQLEKVNKYFNKGKKNEIHVINNTSLTLPDKGLVALLGPSGCGKTTLLNALGGLDKIKSGKIYVNGKRISKRRAYQVDKIRNLEIGYIFQNYYLLDNETVFDNVAISLKMIGIKSKQEIKKRVNYVLETLGIYRYRNRLAGMLSGGERQRVGIARAIVKEPNIIIADEPTGNLDSGNTIEIMNIIKSISKNRLVILVTHETNLAEFYADRIIEIEDGLVKNDYENKKHDILDYRIENEFYLKDFKNCSHFENEDNEINIYNDKKNDIKLTIVVKNNNIYIKAGKNDKIEVVDNDSNIKFINDHYKQIDKSVYEDYEFDFDKVVNKNHKPRYSSIVNPFTIVFQGIKKIFNYSIIKKILLFGFFGSGLFICYSVCNIAGLNHVENSYFIENNENYYSANVAKLTPEKFNELENLESVSYILPGKSNVNFRAKYNYYYQTMDAQDNLGGSLVSNKNLKEDDILYGRLPKDINELVMDKMVFDRLFETGYSTSKNVGMNSAKDYLNTTVYGKYGFMYTIVGIVNLDSPSIYAYEETFINLLNTNEDEEYYNEEIDDTRILDYKMVSGIKITKGRLPENDYEVIVDKQNEFMYPLNKKIDVKVNDTKLTVVGYYELTEPIEEYGLIQDEEGTYGVYTYADESVLRNSYFVNNNTVKYSLITKAKKITVYPENKDTVEKEFLENGIQLKSTYKTELDKYQKNQKDTVRVGVIISGIALAISFIEIFLMIRSSFLSRIKEIGMYRAIGVKKTDIYKMFLGEILAITTIACLPGIIFMAYSLNVLTSISFFEKNYLINPLTIGISILLVYIFNSIIGLLPVMNLVRHTPAEILSRKDLD